MHISCNCSPRLLSVTVLKIICVFKCTFSDNQGSLPVGGIVGVSGGVVLVIAALILLITLARLVYFFCILYVLLLVPF